MAIVINGSGTITGVSVGGLPDGSVNDDTLATGIDATKLTGTIADARISEGSVTQHIVAVRQDIATLALFSAVSDNRAAYNLPYSFIDQFEDDTGVTTQTDVDNVSEYFASVSTTAGNDSYTKLLLHMDDVGLTDSSSTGHTVTLNGSMTRSNTQAKFGTYSAYFDGSDDYMSLAYSNDWNFGSGDFTMDWWSYGDPDETAGCIFQMIQDNVMIVYPNTTSSDFSVGMDAGSSAWDMGFESVGDFPGDAWVHYAIVREGSTFTTYRAGVEEESWTSSSAITTTSQGIWLGRRETKYLLGYMDEFRISKGIARWTADFDPPTAAYGSAVVNATGTLISDTQTAPAAITKMSGVILLKDGGSSTTTLGTHLTISFSATNGTGDDWVNAASYTAVTAPFSTGVTMIKLGETTVPSGASPTIRAVWASQTEGGFESQLHGWAMNY